MTGAGSRRAGRSRFAAPCRRCGYAAFQQDPSLCCRFAALFDECFGNRHRPHADSQADLLDTFLTTLKAIEDGGADLVRVHAVLRAARRRRDADHSEPEYAQLQSKRKREQIARLKARLGRDLRSLIKLHDTINPKRFLGKPKFPTAEVYEQVLSSLEHDVVFQAAGAKRPQAPPTLLWLAETRQYLQNAGLKADDANDLLRQLGLLRQVV